MVAQSCSHINQNLDRDGLEREDDFLFPPPVLWYSSMMEFNLQRFFDTNKKILIWTVFFSLLYLLRGLFGLLFLSYILSYIFFNIMQRVESRVRINQRLLIVLIYIVFLAVITMLALYIVPSLGSESKLFVKQMPKTISDLQAYLDRMAGQQEQFAPAFERLREGISLEALFGVDQDTVLALAVKFFNSVTGFISFFLIGILFSFLILFDYPNLQNRAKSIQNTRLKDIYTETAESVIQFALVVGEAFQAQIIVAIINTTLTTIGLYILDIHPIVVLSTIVFFAGLVPVLGTFISSAPICLLAFNTGGIQLVLIAVVMIIFVHTIETYVLNPRIVSAVLKINPVLVLIILYIGHSLFGLWGVLLGVPVAVYIFRYAIREHLPEIREPVTAEADKADEALEAGNS
jgi:predicted PurR-regulated permease PerM